MILIETKSGDGAAVLATIVNSPPTLRSHHTHASLVTTICSYAKGGAGGCRGRQPQVSDPGGIREAAGRRDLQLSVHGAADAAEDYRHCARGDEHDRAGVSAAGDPSAGDLGGERPLDGDGREHVPAE